MGVAKRGEISTVVKDGNSWQRGNCCNGVGKKLQPGVYGSRHMRKGAILLRSTLLTFGTWYWGEHRHLRRNWKSAYLVISVPHALIYYNILSLNRFNITNYARTSACAHTSVPLLPKSEQREDAHLATPLAGALNQWALNATLHFLAKPLLYSTGISCSAFSLWAAEHSDSKWLTKTCKWQQ